MNFSFNTSVLNSEAVQKQGKDRFLGCLNKIRCKYVYIRIPKTGSASLMRSLYNATNEALVYRNSEPHLKNALLQSPPDWWDHWSAKWCKENVGSANWSNMPSFSVVRNPYTRLFSIWNYEEQLKQGYSFETWILEGCPSPWHDVMALDAFPKNPVISQNSWLSDNGENIVDFIFRLEDIDSIGREFLGNLLGKDRFYIHNHRMNETAKKGEYKKHYTPEMIDHVSRLCAEDLQMFKYDFEGMTQDGWYHASYK